MAERPISTEAGTTTDGLSVEELDAQVGSLLPDRIEMRRRRRRRGGTTTTTVTNCTALCDVNDGGIGVGVDVL